MTVSDVDAQRAADRWAEIESGEAALCRLPGFMARMVIREDLEAVHLLGADDSFPEALYRQICDELLPRDGTEMDSWGATEWKPVLARARELSGGMVR